ncbi:MAG: c-type cytochrome [Candidatus Methylumidiphilus sp.]
MNKRTLDLVKLALSAVVLLGCLQSAQADTGRPGVNTLNGMRVYNKACASCHKAGTHGAPKLSDPSQWKRRLYQGEGVLERHVLAGHVKGTKTHGHHHEYTDKDIIDAVHFMVVMLRDEAPN